MPTSTLDSRLQHVDVKVEQQYDRRIYRHVWNEVRTTAWISECKRIGVIAFLMKILVHSDKYVKMSVKYVTTLVCESCRWRQWSRRTFGWCLIVVATVPCQAVTTVLSAAAKSTTEKICRYQHPIELLSRRYRWRRQRPSYWITETIAMTRCLICFWRLTMATARFHCWRRSPSSLPLDATRHRRRTSIQSSILTSGLLSGQTTTLSLALTTAGKVSLATSFETLRCISSNSNRRSSTQPRRLAHCWTLRSRHCPPVHPRIRSLTQLIVVEFCPAWRSLYRRVFRHHRPYNDLTIQRGWSRHRRRPLTVTNQSPKFRLQVTLTSRRHYRRSMSICFLRLLRQLRRSLLFSYSSSSFRDKTISGSLASLVIRVPSLHPFHPRFQSSLNLRPTFVHPSPSPLRSSKSVHALQRGGCAVQSLTGGGGFHRRSLTVVVLAAQRRPRRRWQHTSARSRRAPRRTGRALTSRRTWELIQVTNRTGASGAAARGGSRGPTSWRGITASTPATVRLNVRSVNERSHAATTSHCMLNDTSTAASTTPCHAHLRRASWLRHDIELRMRVYIYQSRKRRRR